MKKIFKVFLLIMLATCCCTIFASCSPSNQPTLYVVSVEQNAERSTSAYIVVDVKYSDNSTESITIRNGTDGTSSITPISFSDAYSFYCTFNSLEQTSTTLHNFITEFTNFGVEALTTNNIKKSVVSIYSEFAVEYKYSSFPAGTQTETCYNVGAGAGVVYQIDQDYTYILTNFHVVFDNDKTTSFGETLTYQGFANKIYAYQYGTNPKNFIGNEHEKSSCGLYSGEYVFSGRALQCTYVGGSYYYDLAIIKVPTNNTESWTKASVPATKYEEGENVIAMGNPMGSGISTTNGVISVLSEPLKFSGEDFSHRVLRTSAAINGGNSGGGLFNAYGALVGIVNAKTNSSSIDNVGYAIPIEIVTKVAQNILANAGKCGLQTLAFAKTTIVDSYAKENTSGVLETYETVQITGDIASDGLLAKLGLQKNDILITMVIVRNETELKTTINRNADVTEQLLNLRVGDYLYYKVYRNSAVVDLKVNKQLITAALLDYPEQDKELFALYLN